LDGKSLAVGVTLECETTSCQYYYQSRSAIVTDEVMKFVTVSYSKKLDTPEGKKFLTILVTLNTINNTILDPKITKLCLNNGEHNITSIEIAKNSKYINTQIKNAITNISGQPK
jgi:hypothetical protein